MKKEWNLNGPSDCGDQIESKFPAKEVDAFGLSINALCKVVEFYIDFLRFKRMPKAGLSVLFQKETVGPGTLESKQGRRKWHTEREHVFVPKTWRKKKIFEAAVGIANAM